MHVLQSNWMIPLIGSALYLGITILCFPSAETLRDALPPAEEKGFQFKAEPSWNFRNPELDQMIRELKEEKESLALREQTVRELEARLQAERAEINTITQLVARLQKEFDKNIVRLKEQEVVNLKRLAKTHAAMTPEGSANILKELPDDEVAKLLACLKSDEAGPILEALGRMGPEEARRAALLSERLQNTLPPVTGK